MADPPLITPNSGSGPPSVIVSLRNIHKTYLLGLEGVPALRGISLDIQRGEFLMIYGKSGSGKTTLLNMIGTIDRPTKGTVSVAGVPIRASTPDSVLARLRLRHIGFVFQQYNLIPSMTALENVQLPMHLLGITDKTDLLRKKIKLKKSRKNNPDNTSDDQNSGKSSSMDASDIEMALTSAFDNQGVQRSTDVSKMTPSQHKKRALKLLSTSGLSHRTSHFPNMLSGGEQQRVTIARAIANEPDVILADEPSANLDSLLADVVIRQLIDLNLTIGVTLVMISHDVHLKPLADRVVWVRDGKIAHVEINSNRVKSAAREELWAHTKQHFDNLVTSKVDEPLTTIISPVDSLPPQKNDSSGESQEKTTKPGDHQEFTIPTTSKTKVREPLFYAPVKFANSEIGQSLRMKRTLVKNRATLLTQPEFSLGSQTLDS